MNPDRPIPELSPREKQLIQFAAQGLTDTAIAYKLQISQATVGTYWGRVRIKLGPYSRTELVAIVMQAEREAALEGLREENKRLIEELQRRTLAGVQPWDRELIDVAPCAILLVSETGTILRANQEAASLFEYEKGELDGMDLLKLIPERYREKHTEHRLEYVENPTRRKMGEHLETPAVRKDGSEFMIRAALSSVTTPNGLLVTCALRPAD